MGRIKNRKNLKGSFTIEAAMIFPVILTCLLVCVYGCLYLHDSVVLESAAALAAQRGRLAVSECQDLISGKTDWNAFQKKGLLWRLTECDRRAEVAEYASSLTDGKLLVCETPRFCAVTKSGSVMVSYEAHTLLKGIYPAEQLITIFALSGSAVNKGTEGEEFVRLVRALMKKE